MQSFQISESEIDFLFTKTGIYVCKRETKKRAYFYKINYSKEKE